MKSLHKQMEELKEQNKELLKRLKETNKAIDTATDLMYESKTDMDDVLGLEYSILLGEIAPNEELINKEEQV